MFVYFIFILISAQCLILLISYFVGLLKELAFIICVQTDTSRFDVKTILEAARKHRALQHHKINSMYSAFLKYQLRLVSLP